MGHYLTKCVMVPTEPPLLRNTHSCIREDRVFPVAPCALRGKGKENLNICQKQSGDTHCRM